MSDPKIVPERRARITIEWLDEDGGDQMFNEVFDKVELSHQKIIFQVEIDGHKTNKSSGLQVMNLLAIRHTGEENGS